MQLHASISENDPENIPESCDLRKIQGLCFDDKREASPAVSHQAILSQRS